MRAQIPGISVGEYHCAVHVPACDVFHAIFHAAVVKDGVNSGYPRREIVRRVNGETLGVNDLREDDGTESWTTGPKDSNAGLRWGCGLVKESRVTAALLTGGRRASWCHRGEHRSHRILDIAIESSKRGCHRLVVTERCHHNDEWHHHASLRLHGFHSEEQSKHTTEPSSRLHHFRAWIALQSLCYLLPEQVESEPVVVREGRRFLFDNDFNEVRRVEFKRHFPRRTLRDSPVAGVFQRPCPVDVLVHAPVRRDFEGYHGGVRITRLLSIRDGRRREKAGTEQGNDQYEIDPVFHDLPLFL